jgi:hypothetical protein
MRLLQLSLILLCIACLLSAITGVQSIKNTTETGGTTVVTWHTGYGRLNALAGAIVFGAGAVCLRKRTPLAWWLGWVIGAVSGADFLYFVVTSSLRQPGSDVVFSVLLPIFGVSIVALYWGIWWYRQKDTFFPRDDAKA